MTIQSDKWIKSQKGMIRPFFERQITRVVTNDSAISFGTSSYGYDIRLGDKLKYFTPNKDKLIDPKNFDSSLLEDLSLHKDESGEYFILPPHGFALGYSVEYLSIPKDILVICVGKSTYARCALIVNVTPLEPMWKGQITLEFSNTTGNPVKLYTHEGIAQLLFLKGDQECETSYSDKNGKYQNQIGITLPKVKQ